MRILFTCLFLINISFAQSITFSELNYNSDSTVNPGNWVELLNYGSSVIDLSGWYLKNSDNANTFTFPNGTLINAGARLVVVEDVIKFISIFPSVGNYIGPTNFGYGNHGDQVRLFDNFGTQKVFMQYTDSLPWPRAASGTGRTLEISDFGTDPSDPTNWFVGCMFGSPGVAFSSCIDDLVFGEINYHSDTLKDAGDWAELYNTSSGTIDLSGWSFKDSHDNNIYLIASGTQIAPQGRLVLVHDITRFLSRHPSVSNFIGPFIFNMGNDGELIRLFGSDGKLKYSLYYDDGDHGWPTEPDGGGYTLELQTLNGGNDVNNPQHWFVGCPEGSPGVPYDAACPNGISNISQSTFLISAYQLGNNLYVKNNSRNSDFEFNILDVTGRSMIYGKISSGENIIDISGWTSGLYLISAKQNQQMQVIKIFIE